MLRWIIGLPLAGLITALLFLVMAYLIRQDFDVPPPVPPRGPIVVTTQIEETDPNKQRDPNGITLPEPPEPVDVVDDSTSERPGGDGTIPTSLPTEGGKLPPIDTQGVSIPIPPQYPQRCVQKQAEGLVIVQFDVTARGEVVNARIIQSPDSCFDGPVLRTVQKWKYSPNFKDGVPQPRSNVTEQFRFELED